MIKLKVDVQSGQVQLDKTKQKAVWRAAGREVASVARRLASQAGTGRIYYGSGGSSKYRGGYRAGRYQASAPGMPPAKVTGNLANSFIVRPYKSGEGVVIRDTAFYALFLEVGAVGGGRMGSRGAQRKRGTKKQLTATSRLLIPRPFLTEALQQRGSTVGPRVVQAMVEGLKFVRVRA